MGGYLGKIAEARYMRVSVWSSVSRHTSLTYIIDIGSSLVHTPQGKLHAGSVWLSSGLEPLD